MITTDITTLLKHHPCCYCGSEGGNVIISGGDLLEDLPGTFQLIECEGCKLLRQNPRLDWENLSSYYKPGYVCHAPQITEKQGKLQELNLSLGPKKRVDLVQRNKSAGAWLDVGCGSGVVLNIAKKRSYWQLSGVEPVQEIARFTSENLNIPIFPGTFEEYPVRDNVFDVISMWDVLEHLAEPFNAIEKVARLLKPDGVFVFSTPNLSALDRKIFKDSWLGYDLPRHLHLFPDELLRNALRNNGMAITNRFCFTGSYGALFLDLKYWNKHNHSKILDKLLLKGPSGLGYRLLTFLPLRLVDWLNIGTNITYVARKHE